MEKAYLMMEYKIAKTNYLKENLKICEQPYKKPKYRYYSSYQRKWKDLTYLDIK